MEYSLKFENETTMVLTMPTVSGDREEGDTPSESGEVSVNIKYQISDGRVTVLSDAADGVNQIFNSNDSYYESVYAGDIDISEDYRNVTLQLRLRMILTIITTMVLHLLFLLIHQILLEIVIKVKNS